MYTLMSNEATPVWKLSVNIKSEESFFFIYSKLFCVHWTRINDNRHYKTTEFVTNDKLHFAYNGLLGRNFSGRDPLLGISDM